MGFAGGVNPAGPEVEDCRDVSEPVQVIDLWKTRLFQRRERAAEAFRRIPRQHSGLALIRPHGRPAALGQGCFDLCARGGHWWGLPISVRRNKSAGFLFQAQQKQTSGADGVP
jgi:hypothetical protein